MPLPFSRKAAFTSDAQRVELLFERYRQLTSLLPPQKPAKARTKNMIWQNYRDVDTKILEDDRQLATSVLVGACP